MVHYTNKYGIDPAIEQAVRADTYERVGDISVTALLRPPQVAALERQHSDQIEEDVSDGLWKILGQAVHHILSEQRTAGDIAEMRLGVDVRGWRVTGQFDRWYPEREGDPFMIKDFKVTSAWRYIYGGIEDWQRQLNLYALLAEKNNLPVDELRACLILRDWVGRLAAEQPDYPKIPFVEITVEKWTREFAEAFLDQRVRLHQAARKGEYGPCSEADRWQRPESWAVQKEGAARAWRVTDNYADAAELAGRSQTGMVVVHRPGQSIRCESYCAVMPWCDQAKKLGIIPKEEQSALPA